MFKYFVLASTSTEKQVWVRFEYLLAGIQFAFVAKYNMYGNRYICFVPSILVYVYKKATLRKSKNQNSSVFYYSSEQSNRLRKFNLHKRSLLKAPRTCLSFLHLLKCNFNFLQDFFQRFSYSRRNNIHEMSEKAATVGLIFTMTLE